jgi:hypothetical protein
MRALTLFLSLILIFSFSVDAKTSAGFNKRFQIVRDENGKLIGIRDRTLPVKFDVNPYITMIKSQILKEQNLMNGQSAVNYEQSVRDLLAEDDQMAFENNSQYDTYVNRVVDSLKQLSVVNVENVFNHELFKEVVSKFSDKMTSAILMLDPTMISVVNDPTYFYYKNVTYKAVTWGLDFARKKLSSIPMLNTISYVIVQVEKKITERRTYHQNMLLHYLENFNETELGLTHDEVNLIWSSVYESRIPWFAFWESSNAKSNWQKYGVNNFYLNYRNASSTLRSNTKLYSELFERDNYAFQEVNLNGDKVIINLFDNEGIFQNKPAVAYNYTKPSQVARKRIILNLAELGLSFVPLSELIKENVSTFIKSYYEKQRLTEGALFAHFESTENISGKSQLQLQYLNPFDSSL